MNVISPAKNYRISVKRVTTTKETALAPFNLAHPVDIRRLSFSDHRHDVKNEMKRYTFVGDEGG